MGSRLNVQFARGGRNRDERAPFNQFERNTPRTRRTIYRLNVTGLPAETSWQVRSYLNLAYIVVLQDTPFTYIRGTNYTPWQGD